MGVLASFLPVLQISIGGTDFHLGSFQQHFHEPKKCVSQGKLSHQGGCKITWSWPLGFSLMRRYGIVTPMLKEKLLAIRFCLGIGADTADFRP
jgi:hypothetical protein